MTAQSELTANTFSPNRFSAVDVIGISLSTLLFTLVWVGLFSVFLPEKSSTMVSDGLKEVTQESDNEDVVSLNDTFQSARNYLAGGLKYGASSLLTVVQTGGSATGMTIAFTQGMSEHSDPLARVFPDTAVLGAKTGAFVIESQVPQTLIQQSYVYLNTVTFGLLGRIDKELDMAMAPYSLVERV